MHIRFSIFLFLGWIGCLCLVNSPSFAATAAPGMDFQTPAGDSESLGRGLQYLEDPAGHLDFATVSQQPEAWQSETEEVFNQGYSHSVWWLRFHITNVHRNPDWLLEIAYPILDYVDVWVMDDNGRVSHYATGDKIPFHQRPIDHRNFVIPLSLAPQEGATLYLRIKTTSSVQVPLRLWQRAAFFSDDSLRTVIEGLYFGGLLIIALYNFLLFLALKDRNYLYYVCWVASMFFLMACLNGWAFQFLWPQATEWNDRALLVSLNALLLFGFLFVGRFLNVPALVKPIPQLHMLGILACGLLVAASLFLPYNLCIRITLPMVGAACLWGLLGGLVAYRSRHPSANLFLVAWTLLLLSGLVMVLSKVHLLPRNSLTNYTVQLGSLLEVLLLSFALAERINRERALRLQAQQDALAFQRTANEELEMRVGERTRELEDLNRKLQELSDTDQLTGLKNRRFLNAYIQKEFARAERYRSTIAILIIDVDHFKSVNDNYGHLAGDDCLQEIADRIQQEMLRPNDLASRYGGEEFCVILPAITTEGALTVAERIRERIEMTPTKTRAKSISITASVGVFVGVPQVGESAPQLFDRADAALYEAKQNGRNQVQSYSPGLPPKPAR